MADIAWTAPELTGETGLTLYLYTTAGVLINTGGDALSESPASSGRFVATVAESISAIASARLHDAVGPVRDGWLAVGSTLVQDEYPVEVSTGTGTGARTVTITVNDGTTVLQNARVRLTEGANTYTGLTNASGVVTFNLDDATYTVGITKSGYSYTGTTLVVDGTEVRTYSMTVITVTPPDDPALCAVTFHVYDQYGADMASQPVDIAFVKWETTATDTPPVLSVPPVQTTNSDGVVSVNLFREATYKIVYGNAPYTRRVDVTIPDAGTYTVEI
jgi:hypothetical protein